MGGFHETRVRQALMTVHDANVLSEMAAGWRASIGQLDEADDKIRRAIRGLRDSNQFGDATREAAIEAFREMRGYIEVQRNKLGQTARALDAAGGALTQADATIRRWNMAGDPVAPGPAPVADPAATDQAPYLAAVTLHGQQTAGYNLAVASREEEARQLMESLERVFTRSEDKIREQHDIPREEEPDTKTTYPQPGWPGERPVPTPDGWPELPVFPPRETEIVTSGPGPGGPGPGGPGPGGPGPGGPGPGPGPGPGLPPNPGYPGSHGVSHGSAPDSVSPTTTVAGSAQSGVTYQGSGAATAPGSFAPGMSGSVPSSGAAGLAGMSGMSGAMGAAGAASAARAGGAGSAAGRMGGAGAAAGAGAGRSGSSRGASGRAAGAGAAAGRSGPGGKGSQKASGTAKTASSARNGSGGGAGGRGGRKKDQKRGKSDVFATEDHWLDGEKTSPDVLR